METVEQRTKNKNTHHGHAVKRFRTTLGKKQEVLAADMGISQTLVSFYEKKQVIEDEMIDKFAKALNVAPELIKELEEDPVTVIIENNTFEKGNNNVGYVTDNTITNNPIEQILELTKEKTTLFERMLELEKRMLELEKEKSALLEQLLKNQK
ncbi:MAG: hypothetical protein BGO34_10135 [Bacteroidia bacterium 44-10]|nr:MAG: hypothetical protein BGO34_10135 [Bacteroidia bacterium 44-10]